MVQPKDAIVLLDALKGLDMAQVPTITTECIATDGRGTYYIRRSAEVSLPNGQTGTVGDILQYQAGHTITTDLRYQQTRYAFFRFSDGKEVRAHVNVSHAIAHSSSATIALPSNTKFHGEPTFGSVPNPIRYIEEKQNLRGPDYYDPKPPGLAGRVIIHPNMQLAPAMG